MTLDPSTVRRIKFAPDRSLRAGWRPVVHAGSRLLVVCRCDGHRRKETA